MRVFVAIVLVVMFLVSVVFFIRLAMIFSNPFNASGQAEFVGFVFIGFLMILNFIISSLLAVMSYKCIRVPKKR